jgi:hypothetical protein
MKRSLKLSLMDNDPKAHNADDQYAANPGHAASPYAYMFRCQNSAWRSKSLRDLAWKTGPVNEPTALGPEIAMYWYLELENEKMPMENANVNVHFQAPKPADQCCNIGTKGNERENVVW